MRTHFIAIGGSAMHNLAIAMYKKGCIVTGSDDEIFEPSAGRLKKYGLFPAKMGWDENNITKDLDSVILGMHARIDNPELLKAKELELKIFSYPEYIYDQTKDKIRVVVGGSHGKTSITAMILHCLHFNGIDCDYMVGAQLAGFETMVKLSDEAKIAIIEGDEYLSSPIDRRPKFHLYHPDIAILSGIAWDHINVFPTFENYVEQFRIFIDLISKNGKLIYCSDDKEVKRLAEASRADIQKFPYSVPLNKIENGITNLIIDLTGFKNLSGLPNHQSSIPLKVFGNHNLMNIEGARLVCNQIGLTDELFYKAISSFNGASNRLELMAKNNFTSVFKDFAHSPSKLKATTAAVKQQFPNRKLIACMELHTFSSLNEEFLKEYKEAMASADIACVYYNPHTIEHKKLKPISREQVAAAFGGDNVSIYTDSAELSSFLKKQDWKNKNLLMMSSGNFDGIKMKEFAEEIAGE